MNDVYLTIINPKSLIQSFKTRQNFEDWLDLGTREDLIWTLKAFEKEELYEICLIIKNKILTLHS